MPNSNGACALIAVSDTIELKLDLPFAACCAESSIPRHRNEQIETQFRRVGIATLFEFKVVSAKDAQKKGAKKQNTTTLGKKLLGKKRCGQGQFERRGNQDYGQPTNPSIARLPQNGGKLP